MPALFWEELFFRLTVTVHFAVFPFALAVMTAVPAFLPFTSPLEVTEATDGLLERQTTFLLAPWIFAVRREDFPT